MLGDGFMIMPTDDVVCAPADGKITMIFPTLHAFGMKMNNSQELLVHIGINTVELNGEHFEQLCDVDQNVSKGTPIIRFDYKKVCKIGYDSSVLVIFINRDNVEKMNLCKDVKTEDLMANCKCQLKNVRISFPTFLFWHLQF